MTRLSPFTVALLACFCSAIGARRMSAYDKKLELLSAIVKYDYLWQNIFNENVLYKLDRKYYERIIEDELLVNARYVPFVTGGKQGIHGEEIPIKGETTDREEASDGENETDDEEETSVVEETSLENDTRDRIIPYYFVRNIILKRFVVGSFLDMGLEVLMVSFKCLLYKHMVHVIQLINVEMKRKKSQKKAASWSGKFKLAIESILMIMGTLQFTDIPVLSTLSFFDIYNANGMEMKDDVRQKYSEQLSEKSKTMLSYVMNNCVWKPIAKKDNTMEEQVADMIGVFKVKHLYNSSKSFADSDKYKEMIADSRTKLGMVFDNVPKLNGMSKIMWEDILHFRENSKSLF